MTFPPPDLWPQVQPEPSETSKTPESPVGKLVPAWLHRLTAAEFGLFLSLHTDDQIASLARANSLDGHKRKYAVRLMWDGWGENRPQDVNAVLYGLIEKTGVLER